jgi:hypothetical protein
VRPARLVMLECRSHLLGCRAIQTGLSGGNASLAGGLADLPEYCARVLIAEPEVVGDRHKGVYGRCRVVEVDSGAQMLGPRAGVGVEVEGR